MGVEIVFDKNFYRVAEALKMINKAFFSVVNNQVTIGGFNETYREYVEVKLNAETKGEGTFTISDFSRIWNALKHLKKKNLEKVVVRDEGDNVVIDIHYDGNVITQRIEKGPKLSDVKLSGEFDFTEIVDVNVDDLLDAIKKIKSENDVYVKIGRKNLILETEKKKLRVKTKDVILSENGSSKYNPKELYEVLRAFKKLNFDSVFILFLNEGPMRISRKKNGLELVTFVANNI